MKQLFLLILLNLSLLLLVGCSTKNGEVNDEQIKIQDNEKTNQADTVFANTIKGNLSLNQIASKPHTVILTGLEEHRLVTVYRNQSVPKSEYDYSLSKRSYDDANTYQREREEHFMPGIDLIYGYNLLNIAHYDFITEKLNFLFDRPVLVKSLYYPSFVQDSLYKKPINRNYFLVSVYDTDTNQDTLISRSDLRRFYYFNATCSERIQLVSAEYSVERSEYDPKNDVMYVFARLDIDKNGKTEKKEPLHIFWISLKQPEKAKRLY
jgi:hypothetical protein